MLELISTNKYFKSNISGTIPDIAYFFNFNLMFSLMRLGKKSPNLGLILIKTLPYCGGFSSSPPKTDIDSVSG